MEYQDGKANNSQSETVAAPPPPPPVPAETPTSPAPRLNTSVATLGSSVSGFLPARQEESSWEWGGEGVEVTTAWVDSPVTPATGVRDTELRRGEGRRGAGGRAAGFPVDDCVSSACRAGWPVGICVRGSAGLRFASYHCTTVWTVGGAPPAPSTRAGAALCTSMPRLLFRCVCFPAPHYSRCFRIPCRSNELAQLRRPKSKRYVALCVCVLTRASFAELCVFALFLSCCCSRCVLKHLCVLIRRRRQQQRRAQSWTPSSRR